MMGNRLWNQDALTFSISIFLFVLYTERFIDYYFTFIFNAQYIVATINNKLGVLFKITNPLASSTISILKIMS